MPDEMNSLLEDVHVATRVKPVAYDSIGVPELENSEMLKIAEDALDAAKYAYASVAANPEQEVRSGSLEADFKEAFNLMDATRRDSIREKAVQLTGLPESARTEIFGRYGKIDSKSFIAQGFDRVHESLEPLEIDMKLLGARTPKISVSRGVLRATPDGLLLPKENLPSEFEDFESDFEEAKDKAEQSGVHDIDKLADIWGPAFIENPFTMEESEFEEEFEEQAVTDKLAFYITKVKCVDETGGGWFGEWGHDEIAIAGVSVDEDGDTRKIPEKYVGGGFDDGDTKHYSPHWKYHWFGLREGTGWPKSYFMTLLLAEKDWGGFSTVLNRVWEKIKAYVYAAIDKIVGILPGWWKLVGTIVAKVVKWVIDKLLGWIIKIFKDDVFPPRTLSAKLWSYGSRWRHPDGSWRTYSPRRRAHFYGHKGHYYVEYYWKMFS
ncbi:MAG: hypothetical protein IMF03_02780 [Proteobacteria bacterium]|nr:hypothetical protein [Pseudomonadota bacterium]